jgi:hypothetical protein
MTRKDINTRERKDKPRRKGNPNRNKERARKNKSKQRSEEHHNKEPKWYGFCKEIGSIRAAKPGSILVETPVFNDFFDNRLVAMASKMKLPDKWNTMLHFKTLHMVNDYPDTGTVKVLVPAPVQEDGESQFDYDIRFKRWSTEDELMTKHNFSANDKLELQKAELYNLIYGNLHPDYLGIFALSPEGSSAIEHRDPLELIKAIRKTANKAHDENAPRQHQAAKDELIKCKQFSDELLGKYHERFLRVQTAYRDAWQATRKLQLTKWAANKWEMLKAKGATTYQKVCHTANKESSFVNNATSIMSDFEIGNLFVQGLYTNGLDTMTKNVAMEMKILFDTTAFSDEMTEYVNGCPEGKEPFHPSTIYVHVQNTINVRESNPNYFDHLRIALVSKRGHGDFPGAVRDARGAFLTQAGDAKPKGKGKGAGDKKGGKGDAKEKRADERDSRNNGNRNGDSTRDNSPGDSRRDSNRESRSDRKADKSNGRTESRDGKERRGRDDSRDRDRKRDGHSDRGRSDDRYRRRDDDDRDEGRAWKRSRQGEGGSRGRSPVRRESQSHSDSDGYPCSGCGEKGHKWRDGKCREGRELKANGWSGRGPKPRTQGNNNNGRERSRDRSESEDSTRSF